MEEKNVAITVYVSKKRIEEIFSTYKIETLFEKLIEDEEVSKSIERSSKIFTEMLSIIEAKKETCDDERLKEYVLDLVQEHILSKALNMVLVEEISMSKAMYEIIKKEGEEKEVFKKVEEELEEAFFVLQEHKEKRKAGTIIAKIKGILKR